MSDAIDLSAPEVQDAIKAAVKEATEGLSNKRDELLAEVKKLKAGRDIKPEDVAKLEEQIDALKGELSESQKAAKQAAKAAETAAKDLASERDRNDKLIVDNSLTDALVKHGVTNPVHQKAAKALLKESGVSVVADGDTKVVKVGDKALADYITEWAGGDEGKHFVAAPNAQGGGSQGGRSNHTQTQTKGDSGGDKAARLARANELLAAHSQ